MVREASGQEQHGGNGGGEIDVEMILAQVRERVRARRSSEQVGTSRTAESPTEEGDDGRLRAEFDRSVANAIAALAEHLRRSQRTTDLLDAWVRAETEHAGQRDSETQTHLGRLSSAILAVNQRQDALEAWVEGIEEKLVRPEAVDPSTELAHAAKELRSGMEQLMGLLERLENSPLFSNPRRLSR